MLIKIGKHQLISLLNYLGASLCFQQNDQNPSNVAKSRSTFFLSNQSLLSVSLCTKGFFPSPSGLSQIPFTLLGKFPHLHVLCLLRHSESQPKLLSPTRFTSSSQTKSGAQKAGESHSVFSESLRLHGLYSPWNSPGQKTGVSSLSLLQGAFPTQGLNLIKKTSGGPNPRSIPPYFTTTPYGRLCF